MDVKLLLETNYVLMLREIKPAKKLLMKVMKLLELVKMLVMMLEKIIVVIKLNVVCENLSNQILLLLVHLNCYLCQNFHLSSYSQRNH